MAGPYFLAGSGIQSLATPAALVVTVTTFGTRVSQGVANPPNFRNVGMLSWGDADGYFDVQPIRTSPQKILLPPGCTKLGYALLAGSLVTVAEVAPPPVLNSSLNPWDRAPADVGQLVTNGYGGGTALTVQWTYTVPIGRILALVSARALIRRYGTPSVQNSSAASVLINGVARVYASLNTGAVGELVQDSIEGGPDMLPAGSVLTGEAINNDTGGAVIVQTGFTGYLFNV